MRFDVLALQEKTLSGPGLTPQTWQLLHNDLYALKMPEGYPINGTRTMTMVRPDGSKDVSVFGTDALANEGQLLSHSVLDTDDNVLTQQVNTYTQTADMASMPFPDWMGEPLQYNYIRGRDDYNRPLKQSVQQQQGVSFTSTINTFDAQVRPTKVTRSSTLGYSRSEQTTYSDNINKWVLGQVSQVKCVAPTTALPAGCGASGTIMSETTYDPTYAVPLEQYAFGKKQKTLAYIFTTGTQDGTLHTIKDGNNRITTLSDWKRGIPQTITYPATDDQSTPVSISASVNDNGWLTSVVDENGYATGYGYDEMGRLESIVYPIDDSTDWNDTTILYQQMTTGEYGLPAGHWKRTESTGDGRKVTYYDAMWRPVVEVAYDYGDPDNTRSVIVKRYDASGHLAFQSYPIRALSGGYTNTSLTGMRTFYDALDRVTQIDQDAEDDTILSTQTDYLTGFKTQITNPRTFKTVTSYMAFDQPSTDWPVKIEAAHDRPVEQVTEIARDIFGKPTSIKRRDADNTISETRSYTYDAFQRLCRSVEPETGATLMGYDDAGNVTWSASGLSASTLCDPEGDTAPILARKASRTYDARNRLMSLTFPDGRGDQEWHWTPDGLPAEARAYNAAGEGTPVVNAYHYNKRRMLDGTGETQTEPGWYTFGVGNGYDANGHLKVNTYPSGVQIDYAPNALGQATQAGANATDVTYYPNGAIKQFTYGNGIVHTITQNARQLPDTSKDADGSTKFISDGYDYDANGNVAAISDGATGRVGRGDRTMAYDALDRLMSTESPMFGNGTKGTATFSHDALDNLTHLSMPATGPTYPTPARDQFYCYDANWRLSSLRNADGCAGTALNTLTYDVQGNVASKDGLSYDFDYGNRLRMVTSGSTIVESYRYDAYGRRALSYGGSGNILSFYDQAGQLMYQRDLRQGKLLNYIYLGGSLVAIADQGLWGGAVTAKRYQHTDALGTPVAVTDENRNVVERSEYKPYGQLLNRAQHDGPGFTGHVQDALTGLTYMQQRYYDPMLGIFYSVDPVGVDTKTGANFGRYKYASDNPYRFTDPDGRADVNYFNRSDVLYDAAERFDIPGMTTVMGHSWATGYRDDRQFKPGREVPYSTLSNDISGVRGAGGDQGYIFLGGCSLGYQNVPSQLAKEFNTSVISAVGYVRRAESSNGDITYTANSKTDGTGSARWFQISRPNGTTSGRIGSVTMHADGKVTFRAAEAPTGSHIRPTETIDPKRLQR